MFTNRVHFQTCVLLTFKIKAWFKNFKFEDNTEPFNLSAVDYRVGPRRMGWTSPDTNAWLHTFANFTLNSKNRKLKKIKNFAQIFFIRIIF